MKIKFTDRTGLFMKIPVISKTIKKLIRVQIQHAVNEILPHGGIGDWHLAVMGPWAKGIRNIPHGRKQLVQYVVFIPQYLQK